MKNVFTSIDIGSSNIKIVVCELFNNKINVLAASSVKARGIKRGVITNADAASECVKEAIEKVSSMLGIEINKVIVTIPSVNTDFTFIKGTTNVINEQHLIGSDEIVDVLGTAMDSKLEAEREMVTIIPIDFKVDGVTYNNPLGHTGEVLSTRAIMVDAPKKNVYSVLAVFQAIGVEVVDFMINGIGNIYSLRNHEISNLVGAIVDIGAETTDISLYNKSIIVKNNVIAVGGNVLDNDISFNYKISKKDAKELKEKFAFASKKNASVNEFFEAVNENNENIKINQFEVSEIVENRLNEVLNLIGKELNDLSDRDLDYIIFTGGLSEMTQFDYLVKETFGKKAHVGGINTVGVRNNVYSVALGDIIYFINKLKLKGKNYSMVSTKASEDLSSAKKNNANLVSDSMIGKVAQYFFGE